MHNTCVDSNRSGFFGLDFIVKQRFGFGFGYMSLAIMRGIDPRTLVSPMLSS